MLKESTAIFGHSQVQTRAFCICIFHFSGSTVWVMCWKCFNGSFGEWELSATVWAVGSHGDLLFLCSFFGPEGMGEFPSGSHGFHAYFLHRLYASRCATPVCCWPTIYCSQQGRHSGLRPVLWCKNRKVWMLIFPLPPKPLSPNLRPPP